MATILPLQPNRIASLAWLCQSWPVTVADRFKATQMKLSKMKLLTSNSPKNLHLPLHFFYPAFEKGKLVVPSFYAQCLCFSPYIQSHPLTLALVLVPILVLVLALKLAQFLMRSYKNSQTGSLPVSQLGPSVVAESALLEVR